MTAVEEVAIEKIVADILKQKKFTMAAAESCTGGMISARMVNIAGVSECFKAGFVTYANEAKQAVLGVKEETLLRYGAVSSRTAEEMAVGAAIAARTDVAVSVTGIAGPNGGTMEKPVGLVYIGCYVQGRVMAREYHFAGDRMQVRQSSTEAALRLLAECLTAQPGYVAQPYVQTQSYMQTQPAYIQPSYTGPIYAGATVTPKKSNTAGIVILILSLVLLLLCAAIVLCIRGFKTGSLFSDIAGKWSITETETSDKEERTEESTVAEETAGEVLPERESVTEVQEIPGYCYAEYDVTEENRAEEGQDVSLSYYSGPYNALQTGLSYDVSFVEKQVYAGEEAEISNVYIRVEYPVVSGGIAAEEMINRIFGEKYAYYYGLFADGYLPDMKNPEDSYYCDVDSYVTYMSEEILSVVFKQELAVKMEDAMYSQLDFYCVNIDMENGMILENTEILQIDEAFASDFRAREIVENGESALSAFSDEEIRDMLKEPACLVLFYTPYGMEAGLNIDSGVVYVTYDDYERYVSARGQ